MDKRVAGGSTPVIIIMNIFNASSLTVGQTVVRNLSAVHVPPLIGLLFFSSSFLSPEDGPSLPTKANEEFRPFMRRLPEFKFW